MQYHLQHRHRLQREAPWGQAEWGVSWEECVNPGQRPELMWESSHLEPEWTSLLHLPHTYEYRAFTLTGASRGFTHLRPERPCSRDGGDRDERHRRRFVVR